jgi:predicted enzyme related to lactoylglutathione lyase
MEGGRMTRLAHTRIVTKNVPQLASFYEQITGTPAVGSEEYVQFRELGNGLAICSERAMILHGYGAATGASNQSIVLDFEVHDVDAERERLADVIGALVSEPTTQPWGNRAMMFRDPDGNLVNFFAVSHART